MNWVVAILLSAVALGCNDLLKKHAVNQNAPMAVLFLATLCGSSVYVAWSLATGGMEALCCTHREFLLVLIKSIIVSCSWVCVYSAMRIMPISLAAPIRSTSPFWTFLGSLVLYHEIPSAGQAVGMLCIFIGYYLFAVWGKLEGFSWNGRGMMLIMGGTLVGVVSSLYDKYLLNTLHLDPKLVQLYFSIDLVVILGVVALCFRGRNKLTWRWTIPVAGISLILADFLYFYAVSCPDIHISILSLMRRSSVIISFGLGCMIFHDKNVKRKSWSLLLILVGTILLTIFKK